MNTAAKITLNKRKKEKKKPWITEAILELMKKRKEAKNTNRYSSLNREVRNKCREEKEKWYQNKCERVEELEMEHRSREMYSAVKEFTSKKSSSGGGGCIKNKDGKTLFDEDDISERWVEYISELYNDDRDAKPDMEDLSGPEIMKEEVEAAIKDLKSNKAGGRDELTPEMIKAVSETRLEDITNLCNTMYNTGKIPCELKESVFITLAKKPNATKCTEYRTISLMSHMTRGVVLKFCSGGRCI